MFDGARDHDCLAPRPRRRWRNTARAVALAALALTLAAALLHTAALILGDEARALIRLGRRLDPHRPRAPLDPT